MPSTMAIFRNGRTLHRLNRRTTGRTPEDVGKSVAVVDTNVLLNLALPVVDSRPKQCLRRRPLKALFAAYDVHVPESVLGELTDATGRSDDLLSAAADLVFQAAHNLTTHDVDNQLDDPLEYSLDRGESECIWLANELGANFFLTDEFNSTNYLFINLALEDRNIPFTTPHILCTLATQEILPVEYVSAVLTYTSKPKVGDAQYVAQLRQHHLLSELPHPQEANSASCERVGWGSSLHHLPISRLTKPPYRTDFARSANNTNATEGVHMSPRNFREAVFDEHGTECIVCGRSPENGYNRSQELCSPPEWRPLRQPAGKWDSCLSELPYSHSPN